MREAALYVVSAVAVPLGFLTGCAVHPRTDSTTLYASSMRSAPTPRQARESTTKIAPAISPPEAVDANSNPEAVHAWKRKEKNEFVQRVERLSPSEAENLCFNLRIIARDEVFDKVNVKGRLKRYIDGLRTQAEMSDVEAAFRDLNDRH